MLLKSQIPSENLYSSHASRLELLYKLHIQVVSQMRFGGIAAWLAVHVKALLLSWQYMGCHYCLVGTISEGVTAELAVHVTALVLSWQCMQRDSTVSCTM